MANKKGSSVLMACTVAALAGCSNPNPERDPPMVYAEPSLVDLALATAEATRAQMGGFDHLQALCARESCAIRPVTEAEASVGCAGAADRQRCVFVNALEAYALQLFPAETAGQMLAEHLGYGNPDPSHPFSSYDCTGDDPITCQVVRRDCAILQTSLISYDTVSHDMVVPLVLRAGGAGFVVNAMITPWEDRSISRPAYLECVARAAGERR